MSLLCLDLPPADTVRWSPQLKALVVSGICNGVISLDEACQRYQLLADEFLAWQRAVEGHGIGALRVTRIQYYRDRRGDRAFGISYPDRRARRRPDTHVGWADDRTLRLTGTEYAILELLSLRKGTILRLTRFSGRCFG